ncbi:MAG: single-strand selective monofunctional uracil-DNA glycosylase [bacterium]|nr:single-strand selective monofunctional uracil-DNA glycosylase [bacterium]MCP5067681.1 single-strand selective monofunctional uracil-DNA glycosylase [bacterium]
MALVDRVLAAERRLIQDLAPIRFGAPVTHVYNPLVYAARPHRAYLRRFAAAPKRVVYLGMNPGPYGMAQTGVPFGEIGLVRDWMGIDGRVDRPVPEHPRRPIEGFACPRSEVSGARLWGAIAEHYPAPEDFFRTAFLANYCPLVFMEESGKNRTPDKLPATEREPVYAACDRHLRRLVELLEPEWVIGIGKFAEARAHQALTNPHIKIATILHPSPASPAANRGWAPQARQQLTNLGICQPKC